VRILLTSIGTRTPRLRSYAYSHTPDVPSQRLFSSLALWELLPPSQRPDEVWVLLTDEAREVAWESIVAEASEIGAEVRAISLGTVQEAHDTDVFLHKAADAIPPGTTLSLDITQGLRHHGFLFFALGLYLSMFQDIKLESVWYASKQSNEPDKAKQFIDLQPVQKLAQWFVALSVFNKTGSMREFSGLVDHGAAQKQFRQFSDEFLTGLPMEAGITAAAIERLLVNEGHSVLGVPLSDKLHARVLEAIRPFAFPGKSKADATLSDVELLRQSAFIDRYLNTGQLNLAYGFMREWVVSNLMHQADAREDWLNPKTREPYENRLGALAKLIQGKTDPNSAKLGEEHKNLATRWSQLTDVRNNLQHHGMRPQGLPRKAIAALADAWSARSTWPYATLGGSAGTLLICPVGSAIGVLFSALKNTNPDRCLVVCSPESEVRVPEAIEAAGWKGEFQTLVLQDSKAGYAECRGLVNDASHWLFDATTVQGCLTGGTTLMTLLVGRLLRKAKGGYHRPVTEFVLVDRRPREEQRADPWVVAEMFTEDDWDTAAPVRETTARSH
jgi:hypothetical protein